MTRVRFALFAHIGLLAVTAVQADDWPQWNGPNRDGVWREKGILQVFPPDGLKVSWRASVGIGFSSPIVAQGLVYVSGSEGQTPNAVELFRCFDEKDGKLRWTYRFEADYPKHCFDADGSVKMGPDSTPIVQDGKFYATGGMSHHLLCLDAVKGTLIWEKSLPKEYGAGSWASGSSPLIENDLLILVVGGKPGTCVVAFNKNSGKEIWRALDDLITHSSPIIINAGGKRQLIVWTSAAVTSLDPVTGTTYWRQPIKIADCNFPPVFENGLLLVGGVMLKVDSDKPAASIIWPEKRVISRMVLSQISVPLLQGEYVFAEKAPGHFICLEARTGKQVWTTDKVTGLNQWSSIQPTPNGDSVLLFTDQGNLIRARLSEKGYEELSRVQLVDPANPFNGRHVVWLPPAYANKHVFVRNHKELVCISLAATP